MPIGKPKAPSSRKRARMTRIEAEHRRTRASRGLEVQSTRTNGSWRQLWWMILPQLVSQLPKFIESVRKLWESSKPAIATFSAAAECRIARTGRTHLSGVVEYARYFVSHCAPYA